MFDLFGTTTYTVQATGRDYRGHDAEWDEPLTVTYRVNPVRKECEVLSVHDSRGLDYWPHVADADWYAIEAACIEHVASAGVGP